MAPAAVRVRTAAARFHDAWVVVLAVGDKRAVLETTYATEAEAKAKATEVAVLSRLMLAHP